MAKASLLASASDASTPFELLSLRGPDGQKVFDSLGDLAAEILKESKDRYSSPQSLVSTLSGVLNLKRPCDAELRQLVTGAFVRKLSKWNKKERDEIIERLREMLDPASAAVGIRCERADCAALFRQAQSCRSIVAIVPPRALADPGGRQVLHTILERIRVLDSQSSVSGSSFWFLCPSRDEAIDFWRSVLLQWPIEKNQGDRRQLAYDEVQRLSESGGPLQVIVVSEMTCLFPIVVFNPAEEAVATGFGFDVVGPGLLSLCRMSGESIQGWLKSVFLRISLGSHPFGERIPVTQAIEMAENA